VQKISLRCRASLDKLQRRLAEQLAHSLDVCEVIVGGEEDPGVNVVLGALPSAVPHRGDHFSLQNGRLSHSVHSGNKIKSSEFGAPLGV
jgi:hypothetical protein